MNRMGGNLCTPRDDGMARVREDSLVSRSPLGEPKGGGWERNFSNSRGGRLLGID